MRPPLLLLLLLLLLNKSCFVQACLRSRKYAKDMHRESELCVPPSPSSPHLAASSSSRNSRPHKPWQHSATKPAQRHRPENPYQPPELPPPSEFPVHLPITSSGNSSSSAWRQIPGRCNGNVALTMGGQMRTYQTVYPSLDRFLLKQQSVDVFISTWTQSGQTEKHKPGERDASARV
jgi:hypothetical protein